MKQIYTSVLRKQRAQPNVGGYPLAFHSLGRFYY